MQDSPVSCPAKKPACRPHTNTSSSHLDFLAHSVSLSYPFPSPNPSKASSGRAISPALACSACLEKAFSPVKPQPLLQSYLISTGEHEVAAPRDKVDVVALCVQTGGVLAAAFRQIPHTQAAIVRNRQCKATCGVNGQGVDGCLVALHPSGEAGAACS